MEHPEGYRSGGCWPNGVSAWRRAGCAPSTVWPCFLGCAWQTVRQRLREWYWNTVDKQGLNRREADVRLCFAPLVRWVLTHWSGTCVALEVDVTSLGDRFSILTISIVYKGAAIPVVRKILRGTQKHA